MFSIFEKLFNRRKKLVKFAEELLRKIDMFGKVFIATPWEVSMANKIFRHQTKAKFKLFQGGEPIYKGSTFHKILKNFVEENSR